MSNNNNGKSVLDIFLDSSVGFGYLEKAWQKGEAFKKASCYLPYNIKTTKEGYSIEMAVAGYGSKDISVEVQGGSLSIKGKKGVASEDGSEFLYRGLGLRSFQKYFSVVTGVSVKQATIKDGILKIDLERDNNPTETIPVGEG